MNKNLALRILGNRLPLFANYEQLQNGVPGPEMCSPRISSFVSEDALSVTMQGILALSKVDLLPGINPLLAVGRPGL